MIAHIIPKTYLSNWKNQLANKSVYIFDNAYYTYEIKNLDILKNTYFQQKDEYLLKIEECTNNIYEDLFNEIFLELKGKYSIRYNSIYINSGYKLRNFCRFLSNENKNNWIIENLTDGKRYKFTKFKDELVDLWNAKYNYSIEEFFSNNYETHWNDFVKHLEKSFKRKSGLIELKEYEEYFYEFIALLLTRQYSNFSIYKKIIKKCTFEYDIESDYNEEIIRKIWLSQFLKFKRYKNSDCLEESTNLVALMINHLKSENISFKFLLAKEIKFFTSDNPIFRITENKTETIYFPISKDICLQVLAEKRSKNIYEYLTISDEKTKYINTLIIKNSKKNFISIESTIDDKCNILQEVKQ